jgi:hypothetical protein
LVGSGIIKNEEAGNINNNSDEGKNKEECIANYIALNRTCKEFAIENDYNYWRELENFSECRNLAVETCGNPPLKIEDCVLPDKIGEDNETIRCGSCCVWSCYGEISCEDYASENDYDNWIILHEDKTCEYIVEQKCDYGIRRYREKENCCV